MVIKQKLGLETDTYLYIYIYTLFSSTHTVVATKEKRDSCNKAHELRRERHCEDLSGARKLSPSCTLKVGNEYGIVLLTRPAA
jgi:hypothetical protein